MPKTMIDTKMASKNKGPQNKQMRMKQKYKPFTPSQRRRTCTVKEHVFERCTEGYFDKPDYFCKCGLVRSAGLKLIIIHDFHTNTFGLEMRERDA